LGTLFPLPSSPILASTAGSATSNSTLTCTRSSRYRISSDSQKWQIITRYLWPVLRHSCRRSLHALNSGQENKHERKNTSSSLWQEHISNAWFSSSLNLKHFYVTQSSSWQGHVVRYSCAIVWDLLLNYYWSVTELVLKYYWILTKLLLKYYWIVAELLLKHYWIITKFLLNCYWIITELLLNYYWSITELLLKHYWIINKFLLNCYWIITGVTELLLNSYWIVTELLLNYY
jgi:hypothetical protein